MREPQSRRDQREIVVPGDMRSRPPSRASRLSGARTKTPPGEVRAMLLAGAQACLARPWEAAGCVAALVAASYITVNALGLQDGRHPAPILPQPDTVASAQANAAPRPGARAEARPESDPAAPDRPDQRQDARHAEKAGERVSAKPASRDAIGDILRAGDTTASVTPQADKTDKTGKTGKADPGVMQAQKALASLGYGALKADGVMGATTRAAIQKLERDRKLPVTGEAAGRTLRELAARAGAKG